MFKKARFLLFVLFYTFSSFSAHAEGLDLFNTDDEKPLTIEADNGMEWLSEEKVYIARGNAKAKKGDVVVHADSLKAFYREGANSKNEIWLIEAVGHVHIVSKQDNIRGDKAQYNMDDKVLIITGKNLSYKRPKETITAKESLEYWEVKKMAVARGDAKITSGKDVVKADVISSFFGDKAENSKNNMSLKRVEAFGNLYLKSDDKILTGNKGVYDFNTEKAKIYGNVKIEQGNSQVKGDYVEMDFKTGISRIKRISPDTPKVRGYIIPKDVKKNQSEKQEKN